VPLVTAVVLAYAAGLLTGFGGAVVWTAAAVVLVVWWGGRTPSDRLALAAVGVAGFAIAASARDAEHECLDALRGRAVWEVTLLNDASPGAFVGARHNCGARFRLAVTTGSAPSDAVVIVAGAIAQAPGGLVVTEATIRQIQPPGPLARWRAAIGRALDAHFRSDAPLVRALLIADMHDLTPTLRDRFSSAGLSHMLSVSGLHVGLIAAAVALLAQLAGVSRGRGDLIVVLFTAAYVVVIGAPLPAVRAAAMLAVMSLSTAVQRPTSPWAVLAVGAILPLLWPRSVLDIGYQLSIVGMVSLVSAGELAKRWSWLAEGGWRGALKRSVVVSMAATLLTAPLVAAVFGKISLVAPLTNLVAVPLMAVIQPMLFLAAFLLPMGPAAQFVADAAHPLLAAFDYIASIGSRLPGASVSVLTDAVGIGVASAAAAAFVVAVGSRFPGRAMLAGAACVALIVWRPLIPTRAQFTELHMIDVGQGDAVALRTTRNRWVLFDAGRDWRSGDAGQRDVVPYVTARGGTLVAFVLSHPHADHVGGAASTIRALGPRWYYDPGFAGGSSPYRASLLEARRSGVSWRRARPGDSLVVDEAVVTFLAPDSVWAETLHDPNDASTVARVRVGTVTMLLTGDAEAGEEAWLVAQQGGRLRSDVLKVGHHGSRTSSTPAFLRAVSPRVALVSVGTGNMYSHPSPEIMQSLAAHGAIALRTDLLGSIVVRTDGVRIEVEAGGERWVVRR
jgi:competence protein ComEC